MHSGWGRRWDQEASWAALHLVLPAAAPEAFLPSWRALCGHCPGLEGVTGKWKTAGASGGYGLRPTASLVLPEELAVPAGDPWEESLGAARAGGWCRPGAQPPSPPWRVGESQPGRQGEREREREVVHVCAHVCLSVYTQSHMQSQEARPPLAIYAESSQQPRVGDFPPLGLRTTAQVQAPMISSRSQRRTQRGAARKRPYSDQEASLCHAPSLCLAPFLVSSCFSLDIIQIILCFSNTHLLGDISWEEVENNLDKGGKVTKMSNTPAES